MGWWGRAVLGVLVLGASLSAHARGGPAAFAEAFAYFFLFVCGVLPFVVAGIAAGLSAPRYRWRVFWLLIPLWLLGAFFIMRFGLFYFPLLPALSGYALTLWLAARWLTYWRAAVVGSLPRAPSSPSVVP